MKSTISQRQRLYLKVERRSFPAKLQAFHMHSLAKLVVCTNLNFLLPKDVEKKLKNLRLFFLSKIIFEPNRPGT